MIIHYFSHIRSKTIMFLGQLNNDRDVTRCDCYPTLTQFGNLLCDFFYVMINSGVENGDVLN